MTVPCQRSVKRTPSDGSDSERFRRMEGSTIPHQQAQTRTRPHQPSPPLLTDIPKVAGSNPAGYSISRKSSGSPEGLRPWPCAAAPR